MPELFALVTGVSTGIGRGIAQKLATKGMHVFGSVRKLEDAASLVEAFADRFTPLVFDVRDEEAIRATVPFVTDIVGSAGLAGLVNNAGIGNSGPVMHVPMEHIRLLFDINVFGALQVTRAFLPLLGTDKAYRKQPGRIVNITSTSGRIAWPLNSTYAASKFALEALSDGLRRELVIYGIRVVVVEPGVVETPIWTKHVGELLTKSEDTPRTLYADTDFAPFYQAQAGTGRPRRPATVEAVGDAVWKALTAATPRTRYMLPEGGWKHRLKLRYLFKHMPDEWTDRRISLQGRVPE